MVFRTIRIYVITSTFFTFFVFFQNSKSLDFLRFLPCFVRFLELWLLRDINVTTNVALRASLAVSLQAAKDVGLLMKVACAE